MLKSPTPGKPSTQTRYGLDWLNFFLADVQSGVGPFLAIYLADFKWDRQRIGLLLTLGGNLEGLRAYQAHSISGFFQKPFAIGLLATLLSQTDTVSMKEG